MTFNADSKSSNNFNRNYLKGRAPHASLYSYEDLLTTIYIKDGNKQFFRFFEQNLIGPVLTAYSFAGYPGYGVSTGGPALYKQFDMTNISNNGVVKFYKVYKFNAADEGKARVLQATYTKANDQWTDLINVTGELSNVGFFFVFPNFTDWEHYAIDVTPQANRWLSGNSTAVQEANEKRMFYNGVIEVEFTNCADTDSIEFNGPGCISGGPNQPYFVGDEQHAAVRIFTQTSSFTGDWGLTMLNDLGNDKWAFRYANEMYDGLGSQFIDGFTAESKPANGFA
jgi:hypothetical protein